MIEFLIGFAPVLVLLLALGLGRYPGEALVLRAIRALDRGAAGDRRTPVARAPRPPNLLPRGGALLAFSIAGRAPPV